MAILHRVVWLFLPAATKLGQGNVFTGVCDSVNRGGGVCLSACWWDTTTTTTHPWIRPHPLDQTPPRSRYPPWSRHPPQSRHPQPGPPRADTPRTRPPPGSRLRDTVNERPVRILLECILVENSSCLHVRGHTRLRLPLSMVMVP